MLTKFFLHLGNAMPRGRVGSFLRRKLIGLSGVKLGASVVIQGPLVVMPPRATRTIAIGARSFIGRGTRMGGVAGVTIGKFCQIASEVTFETATHELDYRPGHARPSIQKPIHVGDHVWIGTRAIIMPGITIGDGAVVGAGALVTKDVAPNTVVVGIPAKPIRDVKVLSD